MFKGNRYSKRFDRVILQPLLHCVVLPPTSSQIDFSTPSTLSHLQHQQKKLIQPEIEMTNETSEEIPEISSRYVIFDINLKFSNAVRAVAMRSMDKAAEEVRQTQTSNKDLIVETGGSVDGTRQRRGFSSLNGAVAALSIDSGKVIDIACFSRYCQGCINMEMYKVSDPGRYELWKMDHKCSINHTGSAPAMEKAGAQIIFQRRITDRKFKYTEFMVMVIARVFQL